MWSGILNNFYANLMNTMISLVVIAIIYLMVNFFYIRRIVHLRNRQKVRIRAFYVASIIFLFLMARVWVDGFMHLLAVLGLVSAGLVVTNKETIMNFVGWLVITWRGVFAEDDLIQIQQYKGYVKTLGVLYFTLQEVSEGTESRLSGRVIRVPNGLTANNPIINYSQTAHLSEQRITLAVSRECDLEKAMARLRELVEAVLNDVYQGKQTFSTAFLYRFDKALKGRFQLSPDVLIDGVGQKTKSVNLIIKYYCYLRDSQSIQNRILIKINEELKKEGVLKLSE